MKYEIPLVAKGLTAYAVERQNGWERHQPEGAPPWAERRRLWIDAILQGMSKLEGRAPDSKLMERFDYNLEQALSFPTIPASVKLQNDTISNLHLYIHALEAAGGDHRRQINAVGELLEDMASHLPWAAVDNALGYARDDVDRALVRMTAQMPIRFTRVLLGGDAGPHWASGFVSGCVRDAGTVKQTAVYQDTVQNYPELTDWPALCTVYVGRGLPSALGTADASDFDLEIMNRIGDRFLKEQGVCCVGGPYQITVSAAPEMTAPQMEAGHSLGPAMG